MELLNKTIDQYLELISADNETAAGGSTLAVSAAMGSHLVIMYCNISMGKKSIRKNSANYYLLEECREKAKILGDDFRRFIERDVEVVKRYFEHRDEDTAKELTLIPFMTAQRAKELLRVIEKVKGQGYNPLEPDLMAGAHHAQNALYGSLINVHQNLDLIKDKNFYRMIKVEAANLEQTSKELIDKINHNEVTAYDG
ncbi:cyclodeaminase/cyclohydrolase family protein [Natranaerobius thermophilus]|uniref:Methenyl tetrahydrofolate cyclohydrolase-like protein n=1 Tax=Natranaerobius thermophilus (strain ATCC BAA-1301 / DSM 18059 / JW/NM-WN-LF) TaxID=457570 RepID=B2A8L0_NATTJ|nr:cyclodeaminase/cyclohydrolase family protein [Natranaerobius thermophilus]ACB85894.1 Methenyl tetrahydrofolate cyclohydrolase-like protein [Natranaerobius thermophilus JW/NM-WN-LF]